MEKKQIKRILRNQILVGYINIILSIIIIISLIIWGTTSSAFGFPKNWQQAALT